MAIRLRTYTDATSQACGFRDAAAHKRINEIFQEMIVLHRPICVHILSLGLSDVAATQLFAQAIRANSRHRALADEHDRLSLARPLENPKNKGRRRGKP